MKQKKLLSISSSASTTAAGKGREQITTQYTMFTVVVLFSLFLRLAVSFPNFTHTHSTDALPSGPGALRYPKDLES